MNEQLFSEIDYSFDRIYPIFKKFFYNAEIIRLPKCVEDFLNEESIIIDEELMKRLDQKFIENVERLIEDKDAVFIKLNWSSPNDCNFLNQGLKCFNIKDILRLIKGSNKLIENYYLAQKLKIDPILVIFKWYKLDSKNEFRLFFKQNNLRAVSQRHPSHFYNLDDEIIKKVKKLIDQFVFDLQDDVEINQFLIRSGLTTIDIYITSKDKLRILDVFNRDSDTLLFLNWDEIISSKDNLFKYVKKEQDSHLPKYMDSKVPIETFEYGGLTQLLEMIQKQEQNK